MSCVIISLLSSKIEFYKRNHPYHFFRGNRQKENHRIHSLTQCDPTVNGCDWHFLEGNDERNVLHSSIRYIRDLWLRSSCRKEEYMSKAGLAILFDRAGGIFDPGDER